MSSVFIVPCFNPFKNGYSSLIFIYVSISINKFRFNGFEKAFRNRIIPTVTFSAHTSFYIFVAGNQIGKSVVCILNSSIGMEN